MKETKHNFSITIQNWYHKNKRQLPWRETVDPYKIWLSEIILQQTRVAQGMAYYEKFIGNYPTVRDLAEASEEEVLKDWQGLGYYSRARNLHASAQIIHRELKGTFPRSYAEIIKLKGVGSYTAAAISSFAFQESKAVLDGNVFRVLSRYFGLETAIDSGKGKKEFQEMADLILDKSDPATHNQAIMEFGALQCQIKNPDCNACPLQHSCMAYKTEQVDKLPFKAGKTKQKTRHLNYLMLKYKNKILIHHRTGSGIWQNMYDFPMIESHQSMAVDELKEQAKGLSWMPENFEVEMHSAERKHLLSHQKLLVTFFQIRLSETPTELPDNFYWTAEADFRNYPIPKLIENYVREESNLLSLLPSETIN